MPENFLKTPFPKGLRIKLTIIFILVSLIPLILLFTVYSTNLIYIFLALSLLVTGIILIWFFLTPLEKIYNGIRVLSSGQLGFRFNIHQKDELGILAESLDSLSQTLDGHTQELSLNHNNSITQKNELNTIISSIVDGVIVLDLNRNINLINKTAEKITGLKSFEILGKSIDNLINLKGKDGKIFPLRLYLQEYLKNPELKEKTFTSISIISVDHTEIPVELVIAPITEGIQSNLGSILIIRDLTQKKAFEQMQIDFVSMASHEIRTPLTSIINYLATVQEEGGEKLGLELKGFLDRALISAKQLSELANNLLNVSKIERKSLALSLKPIDWSKKLVELVENNKSVAEQKQIFLDLKLPGEPIPNILADDLRIAEVLNNLISNAINYSKTGSRVEIGVKINPKEIITYVADSGIGIPKEAIPSLFTKFFRVAGSLEAGNKGTGLGLYISKSIIDLHHGKIWVESELNKGSIFYFSLPTAENLSPEVSITNLVKSPI